MTLELGCTLQKVSEQLRVYVFDDHNTEFYFAL